MCGNHIHFITDVWMDRWRGIDGGINIYLYLCTFTAKRKRRGERDEIHTLNKTGLSMALYNAVLRIFSKLIARVWVRMYVCDVCGTNQINVEIHCATTIHSFQFSSTFIFHSTPLAPSHHHPYVYRSFYISV